MTAKKKMRQSRRQERAVARQLGGGRVPGSGSGDEKGDGRVLRTYRIENKGTANDQYRLTSNEWDKLWIAAVAANEKPIFHIRLLRDTTAGREYVVLETSFAEALLGEDFGQAQSEPKNSILIRDLAWGDGPYQRVVLTPVRRRIPHDLTVWPWMSMKEHLRDHSDNT